MRVTFVHDAESGLKLFADKVWYVRSGEELAAFLEKSKAEKWAESHQGNVLDFSAVRQAAPLPKRRSAPSAVYERSTHRDGKSPGLERKTQRSAPKFERHLSPCPSRSGSPCLIGLWQLACQAKLHLLINFGNVPGLIAVAGAFVEFVQSPDAARHIGSSLIRIFSGFGMAPPGGADWDWGGPFRVLEDTLLMPLEILGLIPAVAWIPLSILMFATANKEWITFALSELSIRSC